MTTTATITEQRIAATVTETTIAATVTETTIAATIGNAPGAQGPAGPGLPSGGAVGQVARKASTTDYDTAWDTLDAADVGADAAGTAAAAVATEAAARASADSTHAALTTTAHGGIVASSDARLSDARTPTAHAASHAAAGGDPLTLAQSQITGLATALTGKEPSLGNPASDGYVLSSTALGARSWIAAPGSPFIAANDADVPLISRGHSAGQTGNLQEWQAWDESVLAHVKASGDLYVPAIGVAEGVTFADLGGLALGNMIGVLKTVSDLKTGSGAPITWAGVRSELTIDDQGAAEAVGAAAGVYGQVYVLSTSTRAPQASYGLSYVVYNESGQDSPLMTGSDIGAQVGGSGIINDIRGIEAYLDNYGSVIQPLGIAVRVDPYNGSGGGFTELYGIKVIAPDLTNVADYWSIYT